ncbi:MAG: MMPL family transporter [Gammaproteobacteria bacterium]|nr:MMPL family transporter [Gammaproteobacteria bacterium]
MSLTNQIRGCWLLVLVIALVGITGLSRIHTDYTPERFLASDSELYRQYEKFSSIYPIERQQIQLVVRGAVLEPAVIEQLAAWQRQWLQLPTVSEVYSVLSDPRAQKRLTSAASLEQYLQANPVIDTSFYSPDHNSTLVSILLRESAFADSEHFSKTIRQIQQVVESNTQSVTVDWIGLPILSDALARSLNTNVWLYTALGALAAVLVGWAYFRQLSMVFVSISSPLLGMLLVYGAMGWMQISLSLLTQIIGVLVFVVAFTDSLFICHHGVNQIQSTHSLLQSIRNTYRWMGPACFITSLTTAAGFGSLALSSSLVVREFAWLGIFAVLTVFVVVLLLLPLTLFLLNRFVNISQDDNSNGSLMARLLARQMSFKKYRVMLFAVFFLLVGALAPQLKSAFSLGENLPAGHRFLVAVSEANADFNGVMPVQVWVEFSDAQTFKPGRRLAVTLTKIQSALETQTQTSWQSLASVLPVLPGIRVVDKVAAIPPATQARLFDVDSASAQLTARLFYVDEEQLSERLIEIQRAVDSINQESTDVQVRLTGGVVVASRMGDRILDDVVISLIVAFGAVLLLLALAFRSVLLAAICLLPGLGSVFAVAAFLVMANQPVRFMTIIVFTLGLSLVVDHSVHLVFHIKRLASQLSIHEATAIAIRAIGPAIVAAQVVVIAGFSTLVVSTTPTVSDVGFLSIVSLCVGLVLNMFFLPALLSLKMR